MACVSAPTSCSSSSQLRLAFSCRKYSPVLLVRLRVQELSRRHVRVSAVGRDGGESGNVEEKGRTNSNSSADVFSGWSGTSGGDEEESSQSKPNQLPGGLMGAGVAGLILVAGITFAGFSISSRASGPKRKMEPLTTQQEESLVSADHKDTVEGVEKEGNNESETGYTSNSEEVTNSSLTQNYPEKELVTDDIQDNSLETPKVPESEVHGGSDAASFGNLDDSHIELSTEPKEGLIDTKTTVPFSSDVNPSNLNPDYQEEVSAPIESESSNNSLASSLSFGLDGLSEPVAFEVSVSSQLVAVLDPQTNNIDDLEVVGLFSGNEDPGRVQEVSSEEKKLSLEVDNLNGGELSGTNLVSSLEDPFATEQNDNGYSNDIRSTAFFGSVNLRNITSFASIPAPSVVSPALQALPGKVLVPAVVDQVQGQALAALQVLKVIEGDVQPGDLCTRREYARWLVSASSALSRNTLSKVYPAMYIENVTELAFDDIAPEDPDFSSIQGLAEAGLMASKLSRRDMNYSLDQDESSLFFCPESPVSRQDLVSWKMSLEKRQLPIADRKIIQQVSGFIDIDRINPDAWPALVADLSAGENGIVALAFGFTRLFQPDKPVTKAQAAIALATGEAADIVGEELARIEAESVAEKAVAAHSALVDQVEKDINANFEKELFIEKEKINAVEQLAEETKRELERLRAEREEENIALLKERAAVDSEMEILSRLRREVEEQLQSVLSNKVEISYEKERISKLRQDTESENQEIGRLQYELEVERRALSMARAWAEDEAKRAREQAKVLEEARDRWESRGIKVVVDKDLLEEANAGVSWLNAGDQSQSPLEKTVSRSENLVDKLKTMATNVKGKSREIIDKVIQKILLFISILKEWVLKAGRRGEEIKDCVVARTGSSLEGLQESSAKFSIAVKEGAKRVVGDCRDGVEKLSQKFKT